MGFRKNVFIVGAGTSVHCGAPVMGNFLERAREVMDRGRLGPDEATRFGSVFSYRADNDATEQHAKLNLSNIEDLFGLLDLHLRVEAPLRLLRSNLIFLILRTLERTIEVRSDARDSNILFKAHDGNHWFIRKGVKALQNFVDIVARRWQLTPTRDAIISLNYDTLIERAMEQQGLLPDYALNANGGNVRLLKLHGSANWAICSTCDKVRVFKPTDTVATVEASVCECSAPMEPFIVPPTWSKGEHREALTPVWEAAFRELLEARRWVFIGTSLPETDRFLRYLFGLALQENRELDRILILNPADTTGYHELFGSLPKRIKLDSARMDFESAACQHLQELLGQDAFSQSEPLW